MSAATPGLSAPTPQQRQPVITGISLGNPDLVDPFGERRAETRSAPFDLHGWGLPAASLLGLDASGRLAVGAALVALGDAGLPLQVIDGGPGLPTEIGEQTGVIVVSRFAGLGGLVRRLSADPPAGAPAAGPALESVVAALIRARGPRLRIGGPEASFVQAVALAGTLVQAGVAPRILVTAADDPQDPALPRWPGAPAPLSGHAIAVVIEDPAEAEARGCIPLARLAAFRAVAPDAREAANMAGQIPGSDLLLAGAADLDLSHRPDAADILRVLAPSRPALCLGEALRFLQYPRTGVERRHALAFSEIGPVSAVLLEKVADGDARVSDAALREAWLVGVSGYEFPMLAWTGRSLRVVEASIEEDEEAIEESEVQSHESDDEPGERLPVAPAVAAVREEIALAVKREIAGLCGLDDREVLEDHLLGAHLGLDEEALQQVEQAVNDRYGLDWRERDAEVRSVGDFIRLLAQSMGEPAAPPAPPAPPRRSIPFWHRVDVRAPLPAPGDLPEGIRVVGAGPFAEALRQVLPPCTDTVRVVVDAGGSLEESVREAEACEEAPPERWICATRLGADPAWIDPEVGQIDGSRAGFARALSRRWSACQSQVIDVDPMLDDAEAAALLKGELRRPAREPVLYLDGPERRVLRVELDPGPPVGGLLRENPLVAIVGSPDSAMGEVALALVRRGAQRVALISTGEPPMELQATIQAAGGEALFFRHEPDDLLGSATGPGGGLAAGWTTQIRSTLAELRRQHGFVDGAICIVDEVLEDDPLIGVTQATAAARTLARELERVAWLVCVHTADPYRGTEAATAADETLSRTCLSRPRSLHLNAASLPPTELAELVVDLVSAGTTGSLLVAEEVPSGASPSAHPWLDRIRVGCDSAGQLYARSWTRLPAERLRALMAPGQVPGLPPALILELMAATAAAVRPALPFVGSLNLSLDAPVLLEAPVPLGEEPGEGHPTAPEQVIVEVRATAENAHAVRCVLASTLEGHPPLRAAEALLVMGDSLPYDALPSAFFFSDLSLEAAEVSQILPMGEAWSNLREVSAIAKNGLLAEIAVDQEAIGGEALLSAPGVIHGALHAVLLHHLIVHERHAEIVGISRLQVDQAPPRHIPLGLLVQVGPDGLWDVDVDGPAGSVLRLRGICLLDRGPGRSGLETPEEGWSEAVLSGQG